MVAILENHPHSTYFSPPLQGCTWSWLAAWRWLPSLLAAMSAFDLSLPCTIMGQSQSSHGGADQIWRGRKKVLFNLTCRTQHASRKHYHRTFYHSTHTPGDFFFNVYKLKLNSENQIRFEKENATPHSPYNYLLLLPAFSSSQELLCFLMPCSVQPEILFDQKRSYNLQQITKIERKKPQHRTSRACSQHRKSSLVCFSPSRRSRMSNWGVIMRSSDIFDGQL